MLQCPKCKSPELKVWHSKPRDIEGGKTRVRQCLKCETRFTTLETPYEIPQYVRPKPKPKTKRINKKYNQHGKRILKPRRVDPDFDSMTDEELERWIFENN
tara:strand:+ start:528 stop:830 length:303 start_codon:yes stop_codon:yes gene_type:complete